MTGEAPQSTDNFVPNGLKWNVHVPWMQVFVRAFNSQSSQFRKDQSTWAHRFKSFQVPLARSLLHKQKQQDLNSLIEFPCWGGPYLRS